jgi:transcriptional regulator with XRE-family HTH domain
MANTDRLNNNGCVPTLEGALLAKWREHEGLTQGQLGAQCPKPVGDKTISGYEKGDSSMRVVSLLNVIRGLRISGVSDAERLERFFGGPGKELLREDAARLSVAAAALAQRAGGPKR